MFLISTIILTLLKLMEGNNPIDKLNPKEVLAKFQDHKLCKSKCQIEKDALKMCIDFHNLK